VGPVATGLKDTVKLTEDRPYAKPESAARLLLDIVRGSIDESKLPHAYTGVTNSAFTRAGGSIPEYTAGMAYAHAQKWLEIDRSGTRITLPQAPNDAGTNHPNGT
jgi:hypothetical protein